jgi:hypothetical protein
MTYETYAYRYADIILNSDYALKTEIEDVVRSISFDAVIKQFQKQNELRTRAGKKPPRFSLSTTIPWVTLSGMKSDLAC